MSTRRKKTNTEDGEAKTPVKRERSEMYRVLGALEAAKKRRAALSRRIEAMGQVVAEANKIDGEIVQLAERMRALMAVGSGTEASGGGA